MRVTSGSRMASFILPAPVRQLYVYQVLKGARTSVLHDALLSTVAAIDPDELAAEIAAFAPKDARKRLQAAGIRDEMVFPTPIVITTRPSLLGYYRLLLGLSQKQFYSSTTGASAFASVETLNKINAGQTTRLADLCREMCRATAELVLSIEGGLSTLDVEQLPLLMLGAQADGSWRNKIGQRATKEVFESIKEVIRLKHVPFTEMDSLTLSFVNSSGRKVTIALAADPDVLITEEADSGALIVKAAIEIKGGTDNSNAHNRAGEAEKSHQKMKAKGAKDFWTVLSLSNLDLTAIAQESPTTNEWLNLADVTARSGPYWERLKDLTQGAVGI